MVGRGRGRDHHGDAGRPGRRLRTGLPDRSGRIAGDRRSDRRLLVRNPCRCPPPPIVDSTGDALVHRHAVDVAHRTPAIRHDDSDLLDRQGSHDPPSLIDRPAGAGDRQTALRWMLQPAGEVFYHRQDVEGWVYGHGILFTDYGRKLVDELIDLVTFADWEPA